jgi:tetratricopeptide (TPR) repeat protein/DNA-binding CsgD family transcriptional regulator
MQILTVLTFLKLSYRNVIIFFAIFFHYSLHASVFDTLKTVKAENKINVVNDIFFNKVLKLDSTKAFYELDNLIAYSKSLNDVELEIVAIQAKGYYYFNRIPEKTNLGIEFYRKAVDLANKVGLQSREAKVLNQLGFYLFLNKEFDKGFEYLLRSDRLMQSVGYQYIDRVSFHLYYIAFAYTEFKNYPRAIPYFEKAIAYSSEDSVVLMKLNNQLGLLYLKQKRHNEALMCFENTFKIATVLNDTFHIGIATGNLGNAFLDLGKKDTAIYLLNQDYKLSMLVKNWRSACAVQLLLIKIDLDNNKLASAINRMKDVNKLMELLTLKSGDRLTDYFDSKIWLDYYKQQSNLNFHLKNYANAFLYLDSFVVMNDSIVNQNDANMLVNLETQIMAEKYLNDLELLEKEKVLIEKDKRFQRTIRNVIIAIFLLVLAYVSQAFYKFKEKRKKERILLTQEKVKAEQELLDAKNELKSFVTGMRQKNSLIDQFKNEIDILKQNTPQAVIKEREETLQKLNSSTILTEEDWKKFKKMFDIVYKGFFQRLEIKHPELTASETRLLALIKLDHSNSEIGAMIGISSDSVRKSSFRLRKKLNITSHSDLFEFVKEI